MDPVLLCRRHGAVIEVVDRLEAAGRAGDGATICDELLITGLKVFLAREADGRCEPRSRRLRGLTLDVQEVSVKDTAATVNVKDQDGQTSVITLLKEEDEWRIAVWGAKLRP